MLADIAVLITLVTTAGAFCLLGYFIGLYNAGKEYRNGVLDGIQIERGKKLQEDEEEESEYKKGA